MGITGSQRLTAIVAGSTGASGVACTLNLTNDVNGWAQITN